MGVVVATLCFLWVFSINYCPDAPCRYQKPPDESETYDQRWFPIPWHPNFTLQPEPEFAEGAPKQYEYNDLKAQENMARATNFIAWASFLTVLTSALGVWLLVSNLSVTRESSRDETRAYVHIKTIKVRSVFDNEGEWWADCLFYIQNSGATPCKRFEIEGGVICVTDHSKFYTLPAIQDGPIGWSGLPSKEVFTAKVRFKIDGSEALDGEYTMHVGGLVRYTTFFDEKFQTEFSFVLRSDAWKDVNRDGERKKLSRSTFEISTYEKVG